MHQLQTIWRCDNVLVTAGLKYYWQVIIQFVAKWISIVVSDTTGNVKKCHAMICKQWPWILQLPQPVSSAQPDDTWDISSYFCWRKLEYGNKIKLEYTPTFGLITELIPDSECGNDYLRRKVIWFWLWDRIWQSFIVLAIWNKLSQKQNMFSPENLINSPIIFLWQMQNNNQIPFGINKWRSGRSRAARCYFQTK